MSDVNLAKGWSAVCIADISYKGEQCKPAQDAEFSYIDIGSINRNLKCIESPQHVIGKDAPSRARKIVNTGDVLVSLTRPNLNAVALVPAEYNNQIASTGFEVIKSLLVDSRYIFALTRSKNFIDSISGVVQGALYPAAKSSDVQAFEFPLPPLAEQKVIADKLDTLLAQVETSKARLDRIPQILKTFRQSVLAAAVSGKLTEDFVGNQRKLKSIVEFKQGTQVPSSEQVDEKLDGFDRFLRIINFTQGEQAFKYVPTKKSNRIISEDDVVMVRYGATSGFVGRGLSGVLANNLFVISPDESILSKTYLYTFLTL
ncbi:MAG: restriction endonuclease subunit S [Pseudoalteromonas prydzensis]|uniref:restriction endonuclease subunit S n=1 Tax=Pseudoalteromonas prydzensis TaxID=182141 RepID=UPI003F9B765F